LLKLLYFTQYLRHCSGKKTIRYFAHLPTGNIVFTNKINVKCSNVTDDIGNSVAEGQSPRR